MKAMCPCCLGQGFINADIPQGKLYTLICRNCETEIGGCVVGGDSPLKEIPATNECPLCDGPMVYVPAGDVPWPK